ncbi:MAG: HAD-IA family hydrolase [Alloacidobacterium sp.]|jgi:putative hydrolase of the HAD superfamily
MATITTILWDVGGVLLTNGWDRKGRAALQSQFGLDHDVFEERHEMSNDAWEKGLITIEEYLRKTVFHEPRNFTPDDFIAAMKAQSQVLGDSALGILGNLAASESVFIGMLNNESRELNDYRIDKFSLRNYFKVFLSSCNVGLRKPDTDIFRLALNILQQDGDSVAFVDDRPGNVQAANEVGIHGIRYQGSENLKTELERLGITLAAEAGSRTV